MVYICVLYRRGLDILVISVLKFVFWFLLMGFLSFFSIVCYIWGTWPLLTLVIAVSYTHLRAHET